MVSVRVCQEDRIQRGELIERNTGLAHSREESPESVIEIRIRQETLTAVMSELTAASSVSMASR